MLNVYDDYDDYEWGGMGGLTEKVNISSSKQLVEDVEVPLLTCPTCHTGLEIEIGFNVSSI